MFLNVGFVHLATEKINLNKQQSVFFNTTQKIQKRNPSVCMCFGGVVCFFLWVCEELCFCCCLTRCSKQNLNCLLLYKYCLFSCDNRQRAGVCRCRTLSRVVVVVFVSCSLCCRCASSTSCRLLESFGSHSLFARSLLHIVVARLDFVKIHSGINISKCSV